MSDISLCKIKNCTKIKKKKSEGNNSIQSNKINVCSLGIDVGAGGRNC